MNELCTKLCTNLWHQNFSKKKISSLFFFFLDRNRVSFLLLSEYWLVWPEISFSIIAHAFVASLTKMSVGLDLWTAGKVKMVISRVQEYPLTIFWEPWNPSGRIHYYIRPYRSLLDLVIDFRENPKGTLFFISFVCSLNFNFFISIHLYFYYWLWTLLYSLTHWNSFCCFQHYIIFLCILYMNSGIGWWFWYLHGHTNFSFMQDFSFHCFWASL